jgi:hypothetical protein
VLHPGRHHLLPQNHCQEIRVSRAYAFLLSTVGTKHIGSNDLKQAMDDDSTNDPENPKEAKKNKIPALIAVVYIFVRMRLSGRETRG